ncbi:MAG: carboxypeptidase regulatory-like domain-containing protein [Ardenticatenaceae bacterium]|nr:carboxypeptidase regulatory-like domain-containing protein [Anaerolineales bacterium]MCB9007692.1 carboxypeptidase regulatory-like domain-containing protein [Ardenticatenaceae bacterium]
MAHIDDSLKAALYRITCPDSATLGNFYLGLLPEDAVNTISQHLSDCPHCTREIKQLEAFLAETAVSLQPSTAERIKIWIAKRIPGGGQTRQMLGTPAFAMRGGDTGPLMYEAGDAQLSLEVQDDPEHPGRKSILGLVLGIETEAVSVQLMQGDHVVTAVTLDELGNFSFTGLASGTYELTLSGNEVEIYVQDLFI